MFRSKSIKSVFTVLLALLGITFFANQSVKADEYADTSKQTTIAPNPYSQEQVDKIANTLKFYLEDVGYFDTQKGKYIVKDFASLREKAVTESEEQEFARIVFYNYAMAGMNKDLVKYAYCVAINSLPFGGIIWDVMQRENVVQTFINALKSKNYNMAVKLLLDKARKTISSKDFAKLNAISIVGSIALNAISCWGY